MKKAWISLWLLINLHLINPSWARQLRKLEIGSYAWWYIVKLPTIANLAEGTILIIRREFVVHKVNNSMFQEGRPVKIHKREPILKKIRKNGRMFSKSYIAHNGWMKIRLKLHSNIHVYTFCLKMVAVYRSDHILHYLWLLFIAFNCTASNI